MSDPTAPLVGVEPWTAIEITRGETTFMLPKLLPMEQYALHEVFRTELDRIADSLDEVDADVFDLIGAGMPAEKDLPGVAKQIGISIARLLGAISREVMEEGRTMAFRRAKYKHPHSGGPKFLTGNENDAFTGLSGANVYEVYLRVLVLNFTDSWAVFAQLIRHRGLGTTP